MFKKKNVVRVEFCRDSVLSIDVYFAGRTQSTSLFEGIIAYCSDVLSEREIEAVINMATSKKKLC
jgi:hypothetical protein